MVPYFFCKHESKAGVERNFFTFQVGQQPGQSELFIFLPKTVVVRDHLKRQLVCGYFSKGPKTFARTLYFLKGDAWFWVKAAQRRREGIEARTVRLPMHHAAVRPCDHRPLAHYAHPRSITNLLSQSKKLRIFIKTDILAWNYKKM